MRKKIVYIGMEEVGHDCLRHLLASGEVIDRIYTIDESLKGSTINYKSLAGLAREFNVTYTETVDINSREIVQDIASLEPDVIYIVSWSQIVGKDIIDAAKIGCIGFHASLLPLHKGRAPIPWSIIMGLKKSGMTMFYLSSSPDDGDIIGQESYTITNEDDAGTVYNKSRDCAVGLLRRYHKDIVDNAAPRRKQPAIKFDYWRKREPADGHIDWNMSAVRLYDWVRGLTRPFPGAFSYLNGVQTHIWKSSVFSTQDSFKPGVFYHDRSDRGLVVGTGEGALLIEEMEAKGGPAVKGGEIAEHAVRETAFDSFTTA